MPNLDNHMDELFQKASENYPLKTGRGNFDDLMPFIAGVTSATLKPAAKEKRKTALLLLAFLITGSTIGTTYLITKNSRTKTIYDKSLVKEKTGFPVKNSSVPELKIDIAAPGEAEAIRGNTPSFSATIYQKEKLASYTKGKIFTIITSPVAETDEGSKRITDQPDNDKPIDNNAPANILNHQLVGNNVVTTEDKKDNIDKTGEKKVLTVDETKTLDKKDKSKNKPALYYGIAAGVEFNKVKNQPMTKAGLNGGVVLGLQINPKTAIETGVQLSQKKYYSEGKYFKPKTGAMPANMIITSLEGTSTLIEIPVSVKYNFSKKKNTFYGKAGVSSYIITKESNKYQTVVSGQQQEINSTYKNAHSYLASEIRISAGYQQTINKKLNIRVEPYIQIPLKGIGIGNMPVKSAGLQLVLTRN